MLQRVSLVSSVSKTQVRLFCGSLQSNPHYEAQGTNKMCPWQNSLSVTAQMAFLRESDSVPTLLLCLSLTPILPLLCDLFSILGCPPTWHTAILKNQNQCFSVEHFSISSKRYLSCVNAQVLSKKQWRLYVVLFNINLARQMRPSRKICRLLFNFLF